MQPSRKQHLKTLAKTGLTRPRYNGERLDANIDVLEITQECWSILNKSPESVMCGTARIVVKHKRGNPRDRRRRLYFVAL